MKNFRVWPLVLSGVFLSSCNSLPRDQHGWTAQIQRNRVLVVGFSQPAENDKPIREREKRVLQKLATRLGARLQWREGNAHTMLDELKKREIPVVAAQIPTDSPFAEKLGFSQPFYERKSDNIEYSIAVAPGENRLLLLLDEIIAADQKSTESGGE